MSIYTTSTVDDSEYKKLICGRTGDITKLFGFISQCRSVALFGEKRIGKTSLLYLVRDIINGEINFYKFNLVDLHLKNEVQHLCDGTPNYKAAYLSLQSLTSVELQSFIDLLRRSIHFAGLSVTLSTSQEENLSDFLDKLNKALLPKQRLVILIDEVELLLEIDGGKQFFRNLRSSTQAYSKICFVLSGAELWHKQINDKTLDLVNNVELLPLRRALVGDIETFLIRQPLQNAFQSPEEMNTFVRLAIEWTMCKPLYVQQVCNAVIEVLDSGRLPKSWETLIEKSVQESLESTLDNFYLDSSLEQISQQILFLLANRPNLSARQIARHLNYRIKVVHDKLDDLVLLDKVLRESPTNKLSNILFGEKYRIVGLLIERWGKKTQDLPASKKNYLLVSLKWAGAILSLGLASFIYFYTNPSNNSYECLFKGGKISVAMPSSLEQGEAGKALIAISNERLDILSIIITINSDDIEFQKDSSNVIKVENIGMGEKKSEKVDFVAHSSKNNKAFKSQLNLTSSSNGKLTTKVSKTSTKCLPFNINERPFPFKKHWVLITALLAGISSFSVNPNLFQLLAGVAANLFKTLDQGKSSDTKEKGKNGS